MRLKLKVITSASTTTAEEKDVFNHDPGTTHEVSDVFLTGNRRVIRVADGVTDSAIDFSGVEEPYYLLIRTNKEISVKLNGGDAITISVPDGFERGFLLLTTNGLSSLTITNDSGYTAVVDLHLMGDPS